MPNPKNRLTGDQWDICDRCGAVFPVSQLVLQKGLRVCVAHCQDDLEVERRSDIIAKVLTTGQEEGTDQRYVDNAFFQGVDVEDYA